MFLHVNFRMLCCGTRRRRNKNRGMQVAPHTGEGSEEAGATPESRRKRSFGKLSYINSDVVDSFQRLALPEKDVQDENPVRTHVFATICNMAATAFEAYRIPEDFGMENAGFEELTIDGTTVQHLNKRELEKCMEGVVKIHLKGANNLKKSDRVWKSKADCYAVFTCGVSMSRTKPVHNTVNPTWDSVHYIFVRKHQLLTENSDGIRIDLFDFDIGQGTDILSSFARLFVTDENLGHVILPLDSIRKPGVHDHTLVVNEKRFRKDKSGTISISTQFMTIDELCEDQGKTDENHFFGDHVVGNVNKQWNELFGKINLRPATVRPVAYFDSEASGTQAWIHIQAETKIAILAFRGTQPKEIKDVLSDLDVFPKSIGELSRSKYNLKPSQVLKQKNVLVHGGFYRAYKAVREAILQTLYAVTGWDKDWLICVTGHSLGGALAVLGAYELANRLSQDNEKPTVGMLNVGAPRVASRKFARNYKETVKSSFRLVNDNDIIHVIPKPYSHVHREVVVCPDGEIVLQQDEVKPGKSSKRGGENEDEEEFGNDPEADGQYRQLFQALTVKHHSEPYYFQLVRTSVEKFYGNIVHHK